MATNDIDADVTAFIREHVHSVEELDALLLLRGSGRSWTAQALSDELRTGLDSARRRLAHLHDVGLLARTDAEAYIYRPQSSALARLADKVADAYAERRYSVIGLIFSKPVQHLRLFADAFKLKKDDDDDDR